ncbi:MAG: class I SAM-dependent methyltransferase [Planctomycetia bacterium]|nr:class I SAM-dependent methyltransferase [Planctomycetia bacterium]
MAKDGERNYLLNIGEAAVRHAVGLPYSDPQCGRFLVEVGTLLALLPAPPARLLDLGCGTGWTSRFFAQRGYDTLGIDIAPDMIARAKEQAGNEALDNLHFLVCDYEELAFEQDFDTAVFFGSLHHAVDPELALRRVAAALKAGGVCVTCEPGVGHAQTPAAREAVQRFNVTEQDMPPERIIALGRRAGLTNFRIVPHPFDLASACTAARPESISQALRRALRALRLLRDTARRSGIVVMEKV